MKKTIISPAVHALLPALVMAAAAVSISACSSGGGASPTTGSGGAGVTSGAAGTGGGSSGGATGTDGGAAPSLDHACAAACAQQTGLACSAGAVCSSACVAQGTTPSPTGQDCQSLYLTMMRCTSGLTANQWMCSQSDNNPIPVDGSCTNAVCAWACCATSLISDGDVWARCMPTCPTSTGTGGAGVVGSGGAGSGGSASGGNGAGGRAGTGGASGAGPTGGAAGPGSGGAAGGATGGPPTSPATRMICTGTSPIVCHFGGSPGDYAVTVELGGAAAAFTMVQAEMHRMVLKPVITMPGVTQRFSFVVNSRTPEGQPAENGPIDGIPGLDLYFYGSQGGPGDLVAGGPVVAPLLNAVGYAVPANTRRVGLFVAGDSTTCDQTNTAYGGWAQMLPPAFNAPISVTNLADSGENAGSFLSSGKMWGAIMAGMKPGDWVIIQFGHNDSNDAAGAYQSNITAMVTQAKAKGGFPVLVSPPARAIFNGQTLAPQFVYGWGSVTAVMRQVSTAEKIPYIDLTAITTAWYNMLGPNGWQKFHALGTDRTHTNRAGAMVIADFVAMAIKTQNLGLAPFLR